MKDKKQLVLELMKDKAYRPMKFKELAGLLQVPKDERDTLRLVLEQLILEGEAELSMSGRYQLVNANQRIGIFSGTTRGFGFVLIDGEPDVFVSESDTKGARDKDKVLIALKNDGGSVKTGKKREGIVLKVVERGNDCVVGMFRMNGHAGFVLPDNQKFGSEITIPREHTKGAVGGSKVVVKVTDFGTGGKLPEGRVIEILGHVDDPGVDILSVIRGNGLPTAFPEEVEKNLSKIPQEVSEEELSGRTDFRKLLTVTIDGEDAKDLDDAITIERCGEGDSCSFRLGVHIADVSHYVTEHTPLDKEALTRGTSVYLVDRVIPMLPHTLSNGICSLNAGEDRLTLSCVMELDASGTVISHTIEEAVIHVDRRMSYTKVFELLEHPDDTKELEEYGTQYIKMFQTMLELSEILRQKRQKRGSLDFDLPETKITLDAEGHPLSVQPYERNRAHMIIEDFMLIANETVAEEYFWLELPFLYRTHETPDEERIQKLKVFIHNFGYQMKSSGDEVHPKELQKLLSNISGTEEELLISRLTLRSMKQAKYTTTCDGHFGLAAKYYTHFTSPIRRYPDLQIHRIIKENLHGVLHGKREEHYRTILSEVAGQCSRMERRAEEAERETEKLKKAEYMLQFVGESFEGIISGVNSWGIYVELPNTVEGMVRMSELTDDYYVYDEPTFSMFGEHNHVEYRLGQKIDVVVTAVDPILHTVDFVPVDALERMEMR